VWMRILTCEFRKDAEIQSENEFGDSLGGLEVKQIFFDLVLVCLDWISNLRTSNKF